MSLEEEMNLGTLVDRALGALETPSGEERVKRYLVEAAPHGAQSLEVSDLMRALEELRRRV